MAKDFGDMQLVYTNSITVEQAQVAVATVASYAFDAKECGIFLQMLGLAE